MARYAISGFALAALWLLLSGYFDNPLLLGFGLASVILCLALGRRAGVIDAEGSPIAMTTRILGYWCWLAIEIGKANIVVARQVLAVNPTLSPKIVRAPMPPKTNAGRATFANSITLTPGTVSIDVFENEIVVHALTEDLGDIAAMTAMGEKVAQVEGAPE